jgi:uncharacterized membrane protein YwaF
MAKLVLLSTVIAMIAIPVVAAKARSGRRGLQWTLIGIVVFNLLYLFTIRFIYPRLQ